MFDKYLEMYILKMESIRLIEETIEENIPNRINKEISKYKDAILMDLYFDQLLSGEADKEIEQYVQKSIIVNEVNEEEKKINYKFIRKGDGLNKYKNIEESRKSVSKAFSTIKTMYNNLLISIMIEFENIVAELFKLIIIRYPNAYLIETKISYAEVIKSQDIEEIKDTIITSQINLIMRESIFAWLKTIENKHKVSICIENDYVKSFIEAYLRRNIIVHNNARINKEYIKGMKKVNEEIKEEKIGKQLICTKEYIDQIIDASIYFVIYIMNQMLELFKEENENFTNAILNIGFEKIKNQEYGLAREIYKLLKNNNSIDQQTKVYSLINYWQTYKWDNKYNEIENEVEEFDISAFEDLIKLAIYALREDYENINNILSYEFNNDKQNEELAIELEDFPVFKNLRKQKFYIELKEKYPEAFSIKSTQVDEENEEERKEIVKNDKGKFHITIDIIKDK